VQENASLGPSHSGRQSDLSDQWTFTRLAKCTGLSVLRASTQGPSFHQYYLNCLPPFTPSRPVCTQFSVDEWALFGARIRNKKVRVSRSKGARRPHSNSELLTRGCQNVKANIAQEGNVTSRVVSAPLLPTTAANAMVGTVVSLEACAARAALT